MYLQSIRLGAIIVAAAFAAAAAADLSQLVHPAQIRIASFAKVPGARSLAVAPEIRTIFVGTRGPHIYALHNNKRYLVARNRHVANGIAWRAPYLYLAEQDKVVRFHLPEFVENLPPAEVIFDQLPNKRHHGWRYIALDRKGDLFVSVGVACNICQPKTRYEGSILRIMPQSGHAEIYAHGLRNSVGLDFNPADDTLWFTDNGVDLMGDDQPPEELNRALKSGQHFGYPWYAGGETRSLPFAAQTPPAEVVFPQTTFAAHTAPLGVHFYRGDNIPLFRAAMLVALHGSWNRSVPDGYRVMLVRVNDAGQVVENTRLIDNFLNLQPRGRPVDIATHWDGTLLISDDARGEIYQVSAR